VDGDGSVPEAAADASVDQGLDGATHDGPVLEAAADTSPSDAGVGGESGADASAESGAGSERQSDAAGCSCRLTGDGHTWRAAVAFCALGWVAMRRRRRNPSVRLAPGALARGRAGSHEREAS
jgi:MYXO-CTERM domain-containing protein